MRIKSVIPVALIMALVLASFAPTVAEASVPKLTQFSGTLPSVTYYSGKVYFTVTDSEWRSFFTHVYDDHNYVSYDWVNNTTQYLILFDLSYKGLNHYGKQILIALSSVGFPSIKNLTIAFNKTRNMQSLVPGYSNIQALNAGAYPGFSWSVPKIKPLSTVYLEIGIIAAIVLATFVLYFVFNRKR